MYHYDVHFKVLRAKEISREMLSFVPRTLIVQVKYSGNFKNRIQNKILISVISIIQAKLLNCSSDSDKKSVMVLLFKLRMRTFFISNFLLFTILQFSIFEFWYLFTLLSAQ